MPQTITRNQWSARAATNRTALDRNEVVGLALHWPGHTKPLRGVAAVSAALRNWQTDHQQAQGWADIAYQEAIDQEGNVYQLRGLSTRSAANGNETVNRRYGALVLVVAVGEQPSDALVEAVQRRVAAHRKLFPKSRAIVGHKHIRPEGTQCPGEPILRLIAADAFEPEPPPAKVSRGTHVDRAIELLRTSTATGERRKKIDQARKLLESLPRVFPRK